MPVPSSLRPFLLSLPALAVLAGCAMPPAAPPQAPAQPSPVAAPFAPVPPAPAPVVALVAGKTPPAAPARPAAPPPAPPGTAAAPGTPPPFGVVTKDAIRIDGPIKAWQKDDKVWLELAPEDFGKPFILSPKLATGIGEATVLGGLMAYPVSGAGGQQVVEFVRVHKQIQLRARNLEVFAKEGTPEGRATAVSYSPSLLGSGPIVSQPHPQSKAVLVEANGLFLTDMLAVGLHLQRSFRQGYTLDPRNSSITAVRGSAVSLEIQTQNHYYAGSLGEPPAGAPPGAPVPTLPKYLADTRSMFVGHHYSLAPLPDPPMPARRADARIGLMTQTMLDYSDDLARSPRVRVAERWRLEKKDSAAPMSEPVKPITFWIDRNVPLKYRASVTSAILEWNKAFERIGFIDAIVVKQQADDADFDTLDIGYASVRWMMSASPSFGAIGPRHVDPRSGEILDADIGFESLSSRSHRNLRAQTLSGAPAFDAVLGQPLQAGQDHCHYGDLAAEQLSYAMDLMAVHGDLDPSSPQTEGFVQDYVKDTIMHEVGHALGLRHNFRASRIYTEEQLSDPEFTRVHGTTGSVMEYNAINLPAPGRPAVTAFQTQLGPYDYWAIEYAYKPIAAADEEAELQRIAARSSEPLLAFGSDEDAAFGIDPETIQLDLGADPIAYAAKRLAIARDLFQRQEMRELRPDQNYAVLRRSLGYAIADSGRAVGVLVRQIGGVRTLRDHPGSGRDPLVPLDAATQRQALELISRHVLATDGLAVTPALQRRLAPDFDERREIPGLATDYSVPQRLLDLQRAVLNQLMSDALAARLLDSLGKADHPENAFQLAELYERLTRDVWSELATGANINASRRELQRDHVNRLANAMLRPSPQARADARSLMRVQALQLQKQLDKSLKRSATMDAATRAHLQDSADTLAQALSAKLQRLAV